MKLTIAAVAVIFLVVLLVYNSFVSSRWHRENRGEEHVKESSNWQSNLIYSNRDDPRIIVPKRTGGGYTFNFAKPLSWVLIGSGMLFLIALILQN